MAIDMPIHCVPKTNKKRGLRDVTLICERITSLRMTQTLLNVVGPTGSIHASRNINNCFHFLLFYELDIQNLKLWVL